MNPVMATTRMGTGDSPLPEENSVTLCDCVAGLRSATVGCNSTGGFSVHARARESSRRGNRLIAAARLLAAALREIFDEAAYARFLQRTGLSPSTASYAAFQREHATAKSRRPKCC